jgi:hypothetical protein
MELIQDVFMWFGLVVGFATVVVAALEKITDITPSTKDDRYVASAKKFLSNVSAVLDNFNIYTTKDKQK